MSHLATTLLCSAFVLGCDPAPKQVHSSTDPPSSGPSDTDDARCQRYPDADGDGHGHPSVVSVTCTAPGFVDIGDDCDDNNAERFPGAPERCNGIDDDCDDSADEDLEFDWYADVDADGYGAGASIDDCDPPDGFVDSATDCLDTHPGVHPEATEVCNDIDDNCNDLVDDEDPEVDLSTARSWYTDSDSDGFGDSEAVVAACTTPGADYVDNDRDCDDSNSEVSPSATEVCDSIDNDCDGDIDDEDVFRATGPVSVGGTIDGAGGQIILAAPTLTISGPVEALGGTGGLAWSDEYALLPEGGEGGDGRIRRHGANRPIKYGVASRHAPDQPQQERRRSNFELAITEGSLGLNEAPQALTPITLTLPASL